MGNAVSCSPSIISSGASKVLYLDGRLESYTRPVKAEELMVQNPGQFVCDSSNLTIGRRIEGLLPDEELERRGFYFLLPMDLLYSVLTCEEMGSLTYKASKALKNNGSLQNFGKILISEFCIFPSEQKRVVRKAHDDEVIISHEEDEDHVNRCSRHRYSWKPALDTIAETSWT